MCGSKGSVPSRVVLKKAVDSISEYEVESTAFIVWIITVP